MTLIRWTLTDGSGTWTFPINPNQMASPFAQKQLTTSPGTGGVLTERAAAAPFEWTFGGHSRGKAMHDDLLDWAGRRHEIVVTDHMARSFTILPIRVDFTDRRSAIEPWRFIYEMRGLMTQQYGGGVR